MITEEYIRKAAEAALFSVGDETALQRFAGKQSLRLGFLGGSVTTGYADGKIYDKAFPACFAELLRRRGYEIETNVCSAPGMDSMTGNLLADRWILAQKPDLVFVEFAINETTLKASVTAFESLLRKLLSAPDAPAVCLILLRNASGYTCASYMEPIAEHYGLPCISVHRGLTALLEDGSIVWADYADAESHPNPEGHQLIAACLLHWFTRAEHCAPERNPAPKLPEPWLEAPFETLRFLEPAEFAPAEELAAQDNPAFPQAWRLEPKQGKREYTLTAKSLTVYYTVHSLPQFGDCRVLLDGSPIKEPVLHGNSLYGWGNILHTLIFRHEQPETHTLTLEPADGAFYLAGLGVT